jgi:hypothetical protein
MFSSNTTQTSGGYEIQRSLRFNSADSAYLNRTPASAGNRQTWTYSAWVKLSSASTRVTLLEQSVANTDAGYLLISVLVDAQGNNLVIEGYNTVFRRTTASFRDYSAWYHIVVAVDTTQATASNRVRLYINGVEVTAFGTSNNPTQNADTGVNSTGAAYLGRTVANSAYSNAYMTEINLIDGQALTPSSFGEINADTGVWQPKRYAGSYGTNGFYLNFSNNSNTTAATLGADYSGNGNNWTPNNFSVSAGAGNDSLVDSPTSYGTDTGVGGSVRGNYCTLNPLYGTPTPTNGNLEATVGNATNYGTMSFTTGKWYWEVTPTVASGDMYLGVMNSAYIRTDGAWNSNTNRSYMSNGQKYGPGGGSYGASYTTNDIIGIALDMDAGSITFYKNGTSQGTAFTDLSGTEWRAMVYASGTSTFVCNFGQRPFAYTAPSGFKALNTQNLPTPTIGATPATQAGKYFNPVLYTGNGTTNNITGVGFQPDFVWMKNRTSSFFHGLYDVVRGTGTTKSLYSNTTEAEGTNSGNQNLVSFDSNGFTLGSTSSTNAINTNGEAHVSWNWKANGAGVTNTAGSITSTVSANTTSGFSIATFTGNGTAGATFGHGLGVAPRMIIIKSIGNARNWLVYHVSIGATQFLQLDTTIAALTGITPWNDTAPTSSVVTLGTSFAGNESGVTRVAYCFAEVPGYSRFGSYTGNGSTDGPFLFCGFRPAYVMVKLTSSAGESWYVLDNKRNTANSMTQLLFPNLSNAELSGSSGLYLDFVSNGFKLRTDGSSFNSSGATYIFAAFAETPQKFALAR